MELTGQPIDLVMIRLPYLLEHFAVAVAAVSGVLAGRGKHIDLFGVLVLGLVTAFGGGTVRDLMSGDLPVAWIRDSNFLTTACFASLLTFALARFLEFPGRLLLIADAFTLALMTVVGARKALGLGLAPAVAVGMGVITGVAGGIVRDVLTGEIPIVFRPHINLYATAAILGAATYVLLETFSTNHDTNFVVAAAVTLVLRLAALRWKLRLPVFAHREPPAVPLDR
jgi:uncharacterized membrane protein YeiH